MEIQAGGHTTSYRRTGTTLRGISCDVIMAGNGLRLDEIMCNFAFLQPPAIYKRHIEQVERQLCLGVEESQCTVLLCSSRQGYAFLKYEV